MHNYPPPTEPRPSRTPSPTPSEIKELKSGVFDWKTLSNWRWWIRKEWIWYYVAFIIGTVLVALMTVYHKEIVHWLRPAADWLYELPGGWLVPIAIFFVISFPPLFGHEIVAVLCGLVWGLGVGFAIVAAGTFLGEVGNFYAFKWCCRARGEKLERSKIEYACLAKVVRDGGFWIALVARLSAIPGHFTTAVFSTCGMGIVVFSIAAILSLPKQFITVYLGVLIEQSEDGQRSTKDKIISYVVLVVTTIITIWAMWYIYHKMNQVKPDVIYLRRKARQEKMDRAGSAATYSYSSDELIHSTRPKDVETGMGEVELHAPKPLSYAHFEKRIDTFGVPDTTNEDENMMRTKMRYGRGSPSRASEAEYGHIPPIDTSQTEKAYHRHPRSPSSPFDDDQSLDSPFADPTVADRHDRDATFHTAREYSPEPRGRV